MNNPNELRRLVLVSFVFVTLMLSLAILWQLGSNAQSSRAPSSRQLVRSSASRPQKANSPQRPKSNTKPGKCPAHAKKIGKNICRLGTNSITLSGDYTANTTLTLTNGDTLDCQGYRITPATIHNDMTNAPSAPQVGVFFHDANNVTIQNCQIEGFDFGIFAFRSKMSGQGTNNIISGNTIIANYVALTLIGVDNSEITGNTFKFRYVGGKAINVMRDSDRNNIHDQTEISADLSDSLSGAYMVPRPIPISTAMASNPLVTCSQSPHAVFIGQIAGRDPILLTAVVEGTVYQFTLNQSLSASDFSEDNIFQNNSVRISANPVLLCPIATPTPSVTPTPTPTPFLYYDGVLIALAQGTQVLNNIIGPPEPDPFALPATGIRVGTQAGSSPKFPMVCSGDSNQWCIATNDCSFNGKGVCPSPTPGPSPTVDWTSVNNTIRENKVYSPVAFGIGSAGRDTKIIGNTITAPRPTPLSTGAITLFGESVGPFESPQPSASPVAATITRNTVSNVWPALAFFERFGAPGATPTPALYFAASIGLNDFLSVYPSPMATPPTPNCAIRVLGQPGSSPAPYDLPTDISQFFGENICPPTGGKPAPPLTGNFWGLACPDRFLPSLVCGNPVSNTLVTDSHALDNTVQNTILACLSLRPFRPRCDEPAELTWFRRRHPWMY